MTALLGSPPNLFKAMSAFLQSRQAVLTAIYRDTALLRPPYAGTAITAIKHTTKTQTNAQRNERAKKTH